MSFIAVRRQLGNIVEHLDLVLLKKKSDLVLLPQFNLQNEIENVAGLWIVWYLQVLKIWAELNVRIFVVFHASSRALPQKKNASSRA